MTRLWVVEMWNEITQQWEPTVGVALTRDQGRREVRQWREDNRSDEFRLVVYRPVRPQSGEQP
jgi:hypothetical protein